MDTKYNTTISNELTVEYLDYLTDKVFLLLYMFEEVMSGKRDNENFLTFQQMLIQTINGNAALIKYNNVEIINVLSHLESLLTITNHRDYKRHIFKICKLLTELKKGVEECGL
jgi:hypothetical protein